MWLKCIKNCDMVWRHGGARVFSEDQEYEVVVETPGMLAVVDDQRDDHEIGLPGGTFFNEFFEIMED